MRDKHVLEELQLFGENLDLRLQFLVFRLEVVDPLGGLVDLGLSLGAAPLHGLVVSESKDVFPIGTSLFVNSLGEALGPKTVLKLLRKIQCPLCIATLDTLILTFKGQQL